VRRSADRHLAVSTWLRLLHGYALIERELRRAVAEHCTFPQFDVLSQLDRERDGLTFVQLSRRLLVTAGNLTGIVDRLHEEGLVRRAVHPSDRRAFRLTLTPKGRRLVRRAQRRHHRVLTKLLGEVSGRDLRALRRLLDRLRASAATRATKRRTR
jgi:DNA-binding MarR family transcriptional regulator